MAPFLVASSWARAVRRGLKGALAVAATVAASGLVAPPSAGAKGSPFLVVPEPEVAEQSSAYRYANMSDDEAFAELDRRRVLFTRLGAVSGVRAPIRLTGRLHGVWFHSSLPPEERVSSPFEILDARLALALDDFAAILERHDIDEVVHFTMYRPGGGAVDGIHDHDEAAAPRARPMRGPAKGATKGSPARGAQRPTTRTVASKPPTSRGPATAGASRRPRRVAGPPPTSLAHRGNPGTPGTRHPAGLAIDVGGFHKRDGRWLSVARQFQGRIGDKTCGDGVTIADTSEARELRSIVCEAADLGVFTYVLTPNYDAAHGDHFHMEIKHGVRWFLYH